MNPVQILGAFALGILLGWVYTYTKSLWPCMFIHFVNNFTSLLLSRLPTTKSADSFADLVPDKGIYIAILLGCALILYFSIRFLDKHFKK